MINLNVHTTNIRCYREHLMVPTKKLGYNVVLKTQSRALCTLGKHFTK